MNHEFTLQRLSPLFDAQIHDDLNAAVFEAYGWPVTLTDEEILAKLVALNAERAAEEQRGLFCWLRPEFQYPAAGQATLTQLPMPEADSDEETEGGNGKQSFRRRVPKQSLGTSGAKKAASKEKAAKKLPFPEKLLEPKKSSSRLDVERGMRLLALRRDSCRLRPRNLEEGRLKHALTNRSQTCETTASH